MAAQDLRMMVEGPEDHCHHDKAQGTQQKSKGEGCKHQKTGRKAVNRPGLRQPTTALQLCLPEPAHTDHPHPPRAEATWGHAGSGSFWFTHLGIGPSLREVASGV